jgi:hypothetical protein
VLFATLALALALHAHAFRVVTHQRLQTRISRKQDKGGNHAIACVVGGSGWRPSLPTDGALCALTAGGIPVPTLVLSIFLRAPPTPAHQSI